MGVKELKCAAKNGNLRQGTECDVKELMGVRGPTYVTRSRHGRQRADMIAMGANMGVKAPELAPES